MTVYRPLRWQTVGRECGLCGKLKNPPLMENQIGSASGSISLCLRHGGFCPEPCVLRGACPGPLQAASSSWSKSQWVRVTPCPVLPLPDRRQLPDTPEFPAPGASNSLPRWVQTSALGLPFHHQTVLHTCAPISPRGDQRMDVWGKWTELGPEA